MGKLQLPLWHLSYGRREGFSLQGCQCSTSEFSVHQTVKRKTQINTAANSVFRCIVTVPTDWEGDLHASRDSMWFLHFRFVIAMRWDLPEMQQRWHNRPYIFTFTVTTKIYGMGTAYTFFKASGKCVYTPHYICICMPYNNIHPYTLMICILSG